MGAVLHFEDSVVTIAVVTLPLVTGLVTLLVT